ncbi:MAG TPA: hypothetical protein VIA19_06055 [Burkholderiales bacterium]|jgi:hypothetical protein
MNSLRMAASIALLAVALGGCETVERRYEQFTMTFFITSTGTGKGADFGGLEGADQHCQALAGKVGAGHRTWRAYLSNSLSPGSPTVNARDRIGKGPWQNIKGVVIANNLAELHGRNNLNKETALNERGEKVNGSGDTPNEHDILTGSRPDGTAMAGDPRRTTCGNWTLNGAGSAIVGHHDRMGLRDDEASRSWNSSHPSRGCSLDNLRASGGAGLIYCFAAN